MTRAIIDFNLLIRFLGWTVLVCAVGGIALAAVGKGVPDPVIALGSGALAALGAAFIRPPESGTVPVSIEDEPVEVTTTPKRKRKT